MRSKLLQVIGALALLLLVGGAAAALAIVKDRVHVTVAPEAQAAQRGPDALELLRADTTELRAEMAAMAEAIPGQLQVLHDALEENASARHARCEADLEALRQQVSALQAHGERVAAEALATRTALESALAELRQGLLLAGDAQPVEPQAPAAAFDAPLPPTAEAGVAPVLTVPATSVPQSHPEDKPAEAARKSALAFKLPAQAFRFEGRQRLALVPSLSRVGFDAKSTLHDFSGVTRSLEGELTVDLSQPDRDSSGWIEVDAASLDTGLAERDEEMRKLLDTQRHPKLRFEWTGMEDAKVDAAAGTLSGSATGMLTFAGKSQAVKMPVRVQVDASKRVSIEGSLSVRLSQFGLLPPRKLGLISVEDKLELWIALRARTLGPLGGGD